MLATNDMTAVFGVRQKEAFFIRFTVANTTYSRRPDTDEYSARAVECIVHGTRNYGQSSRLSVSSGPESNIVVVKASLFYKRTRLGGQVSSPEAHFGVFCDANNKWVHRYHNSCSNRHSHPMYKTMKFPASCKIKWGWYWGGSERGGGGGNNL